MGLGTRGGHMRPFLLALVAIVAALLASAAPTAIASPSALRIDLPSATLGADSIVAVNVTLVIQDFMCSEPRDFTVVLSSNATEGVKATFALTSLTFTTPAHAYFAEEYRQTQTVNLTVRALNAGQVELTALFPEHTRDSCLAPDGFQSSSTTVLVAVDGPAGAPSTPPAEPAPEETAPPVNATTNETTPATPVPSTPRSGSPGPSTCSPDGGCGLIGDYDAPAESSDNDTPGLGVVGAVAVLGVAAILWRRKK